MRPPFPADEIEQSIAQRFEKQVVAYPDRVAIRSGDRTITYAELNAEANRLARAILRSGGEGERVVLLFEQGAQVIAAVLAVLKAGKTYVPLDPSSPPARLRGVLEDAEASLVLTNRRHLPVAEQVAAAGPLPVLDADAVAPGTDGGNLNIPVAPDAIAYMLYTSGSTGRPKGVVQRHRNLVHFVRTYSNSLGIGPEDRIGWLHSMTFSASNMNVYPALLNGAAVLPYDVKERGVGQLADLLMEERVTICQCVPTVLRHFLSGLTGEESFPELRVFELGGEPVYRRDVELFRRRVGSHCVLINRLAFTEASVGAQYFITGDTDLNGSAIPVGRAADGMEIRLQGEDGRAVGVGEVGEIVLRSRYLSPGYWRRPDLTEATFASDPEQPALRLYRTRDLGRWREDGQLEYFGRKDFRVKINGYTIEVAEIEAALLSLGTVKQVVVTAREDRRGDHRLVAYVVPLSRPGPGPGDFRRELKGLLPDYMVPSAFVALDNLPVTSTGKVDRLALPAPEETMPDAAEGYVAPRTPAEATMAGIWAEVFEVERVGVHDDFFFLGGHSLLATQVVSRIRRAFAVELPVTAVFEWPTVAELTQRLGAAEAIAEPPSVTR